MPIYFDDPAKNGHERKMDNYYPIRYFPKRNHIPYTTNRIPKVEAKLFVVILWAVGIISTGTYLFIDTATWKANVLFIIAGGFWFVKLIKACINLYYETQMKKIELEERKRKLDQDIFS